MKRNKLVFFDVCGTLTKVNNTELFFYFVSKKISLVPFFYLIVFANYFFNANFLFSIIWKQVPTKKRRFFIKRYISFLFQKSIFNQKMTDLLNKYKKENYDVYLASSAFEPVIAELAKKLNVKCIANPLKGKWSKYDRIKKSFNVKELSMAHFYSDNFEDSNISNLVKKFFPIVHDDAELMFWQKKSIGTSNIIKLNFNKETQHVSEYHSINKDSKKLINFPLFYYIKSRPGFLTLLLLNDFLPIFLAAIFLEGFSFFTSIFSTAFLLIFFYSVYEIGGFLNDFIDYKKTPKQKNQRIDPKITISAKNFIFFHLISIILLLILFNISGLESPYFLFLILLTFFVYILHNCCNKKNKSITFIALKILRIITPLIAIFSYKHLLILLSLFFLSDSLERIFVYYEKKGITVNIFSDQRRLFSLKLFVFLLSVIFSIFDKNVYYIFYGIYQMSLFVMKNFYFKHIFIIKKYFS